MNASELTIRPVMEGTSDQQTATPDSNPPGRSMPLNTLVAPIAAPKWPRRRDQSLPPMIPDCDILVYRPATPNGPTFTCTLRGLLRGHLSHLTVPHTEWLDTSTLSYTPLYKDLRATPWLKYNPGRCLVLWTAKDPRHFTPEENDKRQYGEQAMNGKYWLLTVTQAITAFYHGHFPTPGSSLTTRPCIYLVVRPRTPRLSPLMRVPLQD
jgi:hypothetical protein